MREREKQTANLHFHSRLFTLALVEAFTRSYTKIDYEPGEHAEEIQLDLHFSNRSIERAINRRNTIATIDLRLISAILSIFIGRYCLFVCVSVSISFVAIGGAA